MEELFSCLFRIGEKEKSNCRNRKRKSLHEEGDRKKKVEKVEIEIRTNPFQLPPSILFSDGDADLLSHVCTTMVGVHSARK